MENKSGTATLDTNEGTFTFEFNNPSNLNRFWGQTIKEMAGAGIMGEHSSSHGVFTPDPGEGGRVGVGNSSKDDPRFQLDFDDPSVVNNNGNGGGSQGGHAIFQAQRFGDPNLPPGAIEGTIDPIVPQSHSNVTVVPPPDLLI
jgi:hypothetical protein